MVGVEVQNDYGKLIQTKQDLESIPYPSEREFARLMLTKNPDFELFYEPTMFLLEEEGKLKGTMPDFFIINPRKNRGTFVEITTHPKKNSDLVDPKQKQKTVMSCVAPNERYVVLYKEHLLKMQEKYSYNFGVVHLRSMRNIKK